MRLTLGIVENDLHGALAMSLVQSPPVKHGLFESCHLREREGQAFLLGCQRLPCLVGLRQRVHRDLM
jgi:hypothetical protein